MEETIRQDCEQAQSLAVILVGFLPGQKRESMGRFRGSVVGGLNWGDVGASERKGVEAWNVLDQNAFKRTLTQSAGKI
jgi:hypothetical protein